MPRYRGPFNTTCVRMWLVCPCGCWRGFAGMSNYKLTDVCLFFWSFPLQPNPSLTNPPTPPQHRRVLPTRPVSQMIMPPFRPGGAPRTQGEATVSALVSGLNLFPKPDSPAIVDRSLKVGGSPVMRRKPPPPPAANVEMVPVNIRHSIVAEPSALVSTFGHSTSASTGYV